MCIAAFNYFRYNIPVPHHTTVDMRSHFTVHYDLFRETFLQTIPGTLPLVDYLFHSQLASFTNANLGSLRSRSDRLPL